MDNDDWHGASGASAIKPESSRIGRRFRLTTVIEEGSHATRPGWSSRWEHPLVKLIHERRAKTRRS